MHVYISSFVFCGSSSSVISNNTAIDSIMRHKQFLKHVLY